MAKAHVERLLGGAARIRWQDELGGREIEVLAIVHEGGQRGREAILVDVVASNGEVLFAWKGGKVGACRLSWGEIVRLQEIAREIDRIAP